jgi:ribonuclease-3
VIGAVFLAHGLEPARALVHRLFDKLMAEAPRLGAGLDWKTSLQELTAAAGLGVPEYLVDESGPDHRKEFRATVVVAGNSYGAGNGHTKKEAEQKAAETAYTELYTSLAAEPDAESEAAAESENGEGPAQPSDGEG